MAFIEIHNVRFKYRPSDPDVLRDLSFSINKGELVAIQGPSGSGKSTLLYLLGGLLRNYEGTVSIAGQNLRQLSEEKLAGWRNQKIGYIFQQFHLLPRADILENIRLPQRYSDHRFPDERAQLLAERLGLESRLNAAPNELSGGQQQRVAIARALYNETEILLADEPTGNLDSKTSQNIMTLLKEAHQSGRTIIIITHDSEVAKQCDRIISIKDGFVEHSTADIPIERSDEPTPPPKSIQWLPRPSRILHSMPDALASLKRNFSRTLLTMLGIIIGIAAVCSMLTVGKYTKEKILESFAELGVHSVIFRGHENWRRKATDEVSAIFTGFDWEKDIARLTEVFPSIVRLSPVLMSWRNGVSYGGNQVNGDTALYGVSEASLLISRRKLVLGRNFSEHHISNRAPVCILGFEYLSRFFRNQNPIGEIVTIADNESSYGCRVIGIMEHQSSNQQWRKPDLEIYLPWTYLQAVSNPFYARIRTIIMELTPTADIEKMGKSLEAYFDQRYGKSGQFNVSSNTLLIVQMKKFLTMFSILLGVIAFISLAVGGIGITNMMLVSVKERYKEIGIHKAYGATNQDIRTQFLTEALFICTLAGLAGLVLGFALYEGAIYVASLFVPQIAFEWFVDVPTIALSVGSIFLVGVFSGLAPAIKAERLQVIEALRAE